MKVAVIGTGNVGIAVATDLSIKGHDVCLIKTSDYKSEIFDKLVSNGHSACLKENGVYTPTIIREVTKDLGKASEAEVVFLSIQSTFLEKLIERMAQYVKEDQVYVICCSYMSSFYFARYCRNVPMIAETTGPYLEGRVEMSDPHDGLVFRVGCRLYKCPLSFFSPDGKGKAMEKLTELYDGYSNDYSVVESALLNPNMVLHTVGSILSIPRIEITHGNFCMYREAYTHDNEATIEVMLALDEEKKNVLEALHQRPIDIMEAGGFRNGLSSFYQYSESSDRAISPTSVHSRYITEDVSQGLVLLEDIAKHLDIKTPIATAMINIASAALQYDFRSHGRTRKHLGIEKYIDNLAHDE